MSHMVWVDDIPRLTSEYLDIPNTLPRKSRKCPNYKCVMIIVENYRYV